MNLDALFPIGGDHAIQNFTCQLDWLDPLGDKDFQALKMRFQQHLQVFKNLKPHQSIVVNLAAASAAPEVQANSTAGFTAEMAAQLGQPPRRAISLSPPQATITFNDYSRWDKIRPDLQSYVSNIVAGAVTSTNRRGLKSIGLQYTDGFLWKADPNSLVSEEVFNRKTDYLSPIIFSTTSDWHCNQGWFEKSRRPDSRQLVNVNVQRATAELASLTIVTAHRQIFDRALWESPEAMSGVIMEIYEEFHDDNKRLLSQLLTAGVCEKIKLTAPK